MATEEKGLAPEIWDINPFCIEAYTTKEVEVKLMVHLYNPLPSTLLVLQGSRVLEQVSVEGGEDIVRFHLKPCAPGVLNVVVIAKASEQNQENVAVPGADSTGTEQCVQSNMYVSSTSPLPVLPRDSAKEMMRIFDDTAKYAKECSLPPQDGGSSDFLLPIGHQFTEEQERVIHEMLRRKLFRPFAADLEFLLNHSTLHDYDSMPSNASSECGKEDVLSVFRTMVVFLSCSQAWYTLSYALKAWHDQGVHIIGDEWKLSADGLKSKYMEGSTQGPGEATVGFFADYFSSIGGMEVEHIGQGDEHDDQWPETLSTIDPNAQGDVGSVSQGQSQAPHGTLECQASGMDMLGRKAASWTGDQERPQPDIAGYAAAMESLPGCSLEDELMPVFDSPQLTLQGLTGESPNLEVFDGNDETLPKPEVPLRPRESDEKECSSSTFGGCFSKGSIDDHLAFLSEQFSDSLDKNVISSCPLPVIPPSFASALLSTENTSLSMAIATLLVTCWLYLVRGEWNAVVRMMIVGGGVLMAFIYWTREVQFQYRSHLVWVSRLAVILLLFCHGSGWCHCPCICSPTAGAQCYGGVLQSLFWLFTSASGYQLRVARQVGLFVVEGLAFLYSMSNRSPGCNGVSVMGLVLAGEVISLMMSLSDRQVGGLMRQRGGSSSGNTSFTNMSHKTKAE